jgi:hypothetical protein
MDDPPDVTRPPGFPIPKGQIVFGEVFPCYKCKNSKQPGKTYGTNGYETCSACNGSMYIKRGQVSEG